MSEAVIFSHVDIVFGPDAPKALALLDAGKSRDEILSQTNHVIGVADADLTVETGEIFVMMGLSGQRAEQNRARPCAGASCRQNGGCGCLRGGNATRCAGALGGDGVSAIRAAALALGARQCRPWA